jgi:hypothetical protein
MMNTKTSAETGTAKASRPYDIIQFEVVTDTHAEIHACGCSHSKRRNSLSYVFQHSYKGDTLAELQREIAFEWNADLASDSGMEVEEYIEKEGGYLVGTKIGSCIRIMPCVKLGGCK